MDTRTGVIDTLENFEKRMSSDEVDKFVKPLQMSALSEALAPGLLNEVMKGHRVKIDKYAPCPCGSGKKFKFCCFTPGVNS